MNRLLIWDIDGTLLTVNRAGRAAMDITFEQLFGVKNGFDNIDMSGRLDGVIIKDAIEKNSHIFGDSASIDVGEFYRRYEMNLIKLLDGAYVGKTYPGIIDVLNHTHKNDDIYNVIGTGNCKVGALAKLASQNLDSFFNCGAYGDEYLDRGKLIKGAIDKAERAFNVKFEPSNIYVLGDTIHDINAAKDAGVKSIAVLTGSDVLAKIKRHRPDYIFDDFEKYNDLIDIIG